MSRKDYVAIASCFQIARDVMQIVGSDDETWGIVQGIERDIANVFADDNPNFDRGRFLSACASKS